MQLKDIDGVRRHPLQAFNVNNIGPFTITDHFSVGINPKTAQPSPVSTSGPGSECLHTCGCAWGYVRVCARLIKTMLPALFREGGERGAGEEKEKRKGNRKNEEGGGGKQRIKHTKRYNIIDKYLEIIRLPAEKKRKKNIYICGRLKLTTQAASLA